VHAAEGTRNRMKYVVFYETAPDAGAGIAELWHEALL
jgi:hypothetical protein